MDRERAVDVARSVERESSEFYRTLAMEAKDQTARDFFEKIAEDESGHFQKLLKTEI